jgi:hypothetical protein
VRPQNRGNSRPAHYHDSGTRGIKKNLPLVTGGDRFPAWLNINKVLRHPLVSMVRVADLACLDGKFAVRNLRQIGGIWFEDSEGKPPDK